MTTAVGVFARWISVALVLAPFGCDIVVGVPFDRARRKDGCGDGEVDPGELCDDGNDADADGCEADCTLPRCGNAIADPGEQCDDGNELNGDSCERDCRRPICGNAIVDAGEHCDDGNPVNGDGCKTDCSCEPVLGEELLCTTAARPRCYAHKKYEPKVTAGVVWYQAAGDIDGNGSIDVVTTNPETNLVTFRLNDGCGHLGTIPIQVVEELIGPGPIALDDFDRDGDLDAAVALLGNKVAVLYNTGTGAQRFVNAGVIKTNMGPNPVVLYLRTGELTGDGFPDALMVNRDTAQFVILRNDGAGQLIPDSVPIALGEYAPKALVADVDADGDGDVVAINSWDDNLWVFFNQGGGQLSQPVPHATSADPNGLVVADLTGDGYLDIATAGWLGLSVSVLANRGNREPGDFVAHVDYALGTELNSLAAADFDGDGDLDLTASQKYGGRVTMLLNDGHGSFGAAQDLLLGDDPHHQVLPDLNRDGRADIVVTTADGLSVSVSLP